jgi:hypothetical protein
MTRSGQLATHAPQESQCAAMLFAVDHGGRIGSGAGLSLPRRKFLRLTLEVVFMGVA